MKLSEIVEQHKNVNLRQVVFPKRPKTCHDCKHHYYFDVRYDPDDAGFNHYCSLIHDSGFVLGDLYLGEHGEVNSILENCVCDLFEEGRGHYDEEKEKEYNRKIYGF